MASSDTLTREMSEKAMFYHAVRGIMRAVNVSAQVKMKCVEEELDATDKRLAELKKK